MKQSRTTSRRSFLKQGLTATGLVVAGGLAGCTAPGGHPAARRKPRMVMAPKRDKLRIAFVGTGGIGNHHLKATEPLGVTCPCFCDVDTERMKRAVEMYPQAARYQDYRRMFDKEHKNFDAVMVGVPDHHHFPATMWAMQLGKHVYTQKPLTHTVWEARQLTEAAKQYAVVTQMGNQGHAGEGWRLVYEYINNGVLGEIKEVHAWTDRPIWPQGMNRPEESTPVPANLDWDAWLGPAPERPYAEKVYHPFRWRGWWDFGAGALGDMACHTMDGTFWALDPGYPTAVEPVAFTAVNAETFPKAAIVKWEFPRRGRRRAFEAYWYDGGLKPTLPAELEMKRRLSGTGNLYVGTKATMLVSGDYGNSPRIIPESKMKEIGVPPPKKLLPRSPGHFEEWVMACKGQESIDFPKSRFAYSAPLTETVQLGNVALRVGRRIEWDGKNLQVTNIPEANEFISKTYRAGWKV
jgi:predicted dehydrogenase